MIYDFVRLIVFFDLPMVTKKDVRAYNAFRKWLIKQGYIMMQFSIYCKLFGNRDAAVQHVNDLRKNVPSQGQVRVMMVTEKQYTKIILLTGEVSAQEEMICEDPFVRL